MCLKMRLFTLLMVLLIPDSPAASVVKKGNKRRAAEAETAGTGRAVLWRNPADIASRNLFFGPGGHQHQPHGMFTFLKEDLAGSNPKFTVRDQDGVKWKVKLGAEARPETVASRLVWAVGYFTNEDYFLEDLRVQDMPGHLHRGQRLVASDGSMHNVRLKRYLNGEEKIGSWQWRQEPFSGTRELNGLRVMMALINNWDLTDENTAIYEDEHGGAEGVPEQIYMVSDLGASFGKVGLSWPLGKARGNLNAFRRSKFISRVTPDGVDFRTPARPAWFFLATPKEYNLRLHLRWIGRQIPRQDVRWMGQLLARLSGDQIRDAFRAAGYSTQDVEGFTSVVEERIAELNKL